VLQVRCLLTRDPLQQLGANLQAQGKHDAFNFYCNRISGIGGLDTTPHKTTHNT
jgi:hypothetical protein